MAVRTASAESTGTKTTTLSSGPAGAGRMGARSVSPSARASDSETPDTAWSALVWAASSAQPPAVRVCRVRPLGVSAATELTGVRNSGWCTTSRSAPHSTASRATSTVGSTANITRATSADGSPATSPTASHESAVRGGYQACSRSTTSARLGMRAG